MNAIKAWGRVTKPRLIQLALLLASADSLLNAQSIELTFESVATGPSLSNAGTNSSGMALGSFSAVGSLPPWLIRTTGSNSYTIASDFGIRVNRISGTSPSYTLQCSVSGGSGFTWLVGSTTLSASPATISASESYGTVVTHKLSMVVPNSEPNGSISATLDVTAVSN